MDKAPLMVPGCLVVFGGVSWRRRRVRLFMLPVCVGLGLGLDGLAGWRVGGLAGLELVGRWGDGAMGRVTAAVSAHSK